MDYVAENGARSGSAAMETMELDNGGMARSLNGNLRHPYIASYRIFGEHGSIEAEPGRITVYSYDKEFHYDITGESVSYMPFAHRPKKDHGSISNSDLTGFGYFIAKILGDPLGEKYSIDVYQALDMALPGLLAYRSIVDHGMPYEVPDLRDLTVRERYRNDFYSTDPRTPEEFRLPTNKSGTPDVDESVYAAVRERLAQVDLTPGMK